MAKAHISGAENVLEWYDRNCTTSFYSVWQGKQLLFSYNTEDENGRDKLANDLLAFEQNNIADVMTIKLHPAFDKNGFITDKTPVYASLNFRCVDVENSPIQKSMIAGDRPYSPSVTAMLQESLEVNKKLLAYLEEEEEEEESPTENILAGILSDPQIKPLLVGMLGKFFQPNQKPQPQSMAGIMQQIDLDLLQNLMNRGVTTEVLQKLVLMDDAKLQSLIMML